MGKQSFAIGHVGLVVVQAPEEFTMFSLHVLDDQGQPAPERLFSGPVDVNMPAQLRAVADHIEGLARKRMS